MRCQGTTGPVGLPAEKGQPQRVLRLLPSTCSSRTALPGQLAARLGHGESRPTRLYHQQPVSQGSRNDINI